MVSLINDDGVVSIFNLAGTHTHGKFTVAGNRNVCTFFVNIVPMFVFVPSFAVATQNIAERMPCLV